MSKEEQDQQEMNEIGFRVSQYDSLSAEQSRKLYIAFVRKNLEKDRLNAEIKRLESVNETLSALCLSKTEKLKIAAHALEQFRDVVLKEPLGFQKPRYIAREALSTINGGEKNE